jgi:hypothetical protein
MTIHWVDVLERHGTRFPSLHRRQIVGEAVDPLDPRQTRTCERFSRSDGFVLTLEPEGIRIGPDAKFFRRFAPSVLVPWHDVVGLPMPEVAA